LCLLHEDWENKNEQETREEFLKEIQDGIRDFEGCILPGFSFSKRELENTLFFWDTTIKGDILFDEAKINGNTSFIGATIKGNALFDDAIIRGDALFDKATIEGWATFNRTTIKGSAGFFEATIKGNTSFRGATIKRDALFGGATIEGNAWFDGSTIKGDAIFRGATIKGHVLFREATIKGYTSFDMATVEGPASFEGATLGENVTFLASKTSFLTFVDATFNDIRGQENACREAKRTQEQAGNRELADYHFYREMEAKRKQRHSIMRFIELPLQYLFGYGVYPSRVALTWLATILVFTLIYWLGKAVESADSLLDYIYFSVVTAATPGYGGYRPVSGVWQGVASIEAIIGTFMWAALIATFARKFMR
jgi:hypothetical protein